MFHIDPEVRRRGVDFDAPCEGDAGFDLRSAESIVLETAKQAVVSTGLKLAIPKGYVGLIRERSSMALKRVYTHAGVIDAAYRGEIKIVLSNTSEHNFHIEIGDKIAQLIVVPCVTACHEAIEVDQLGVTRRGEGGFGSTGR